MIATDGSIFEITAMLFSARVAIASLSRLFILFQRARRIEAFGFFC